VSGVWHVVSVTFTSTRWQRFTWWLPSKAWADDGWRWRVAQLADKLPRQCWSDLVEWALRRHEDDPDTPWNDLRRRVPLRRQSPTGCLDDAARNGTCYCAKVRTAEADADMCARGANPAAVIVRAVAR
jgi:hypothetical protein